MAVGSTATDSSEGEVAPPPPSPSYRYAFERQIKFLSPTVRTKSYVTLWKEVFSHGGNVLRIYQLKPWTFVEYPSVEEADAAYDLMKKKNVVGPLYRTKELIRALKGLDPVVPRTDAKLTFQFFKQLKFFTEECEDKSEEGVKGSFHSAGRVMGVTSLGPWTFVQFKSPEKARLALASMKQLNESLPSLRETVELTQFLGPAKPEARFKHAFDRQLKFDTKANEEITIPEIKEIFNAGGTVSKVYHLGRWTFVEYPSVEEAEAAFNIMSKKKEINLLTRTEELVAALRAKKKTRQLRIARNKNEDVQTVLKKCSCPAAVPLNVFESWHWMFVEYLTPKDANDAFNFLRDNQILTDVQRTAELMEWCRKNKMFSSTRYDERQLKFNTAENLDKLPSLDSVKEYFSIAGKVVEVFYKNLDTHVEFSTCAEALKALHVMSTEYPLCDLQPAKNLNLTTEGLQSILEE